MASRTQHPGAYHNPSDDRPYRGNPPQRYERFDTSGLQQGTNITSGKQVDRSRGGASNRVSPSGGEYLSGAPREYPSEAYSDQGFGKQTRTRTNWRTEDRIFGPDSVVHEQMSPGEYRGQFRGSGPRGYRRSDSRIREDACEALTEDSYLDASNIDVSAQDGEITLSGTVTSRADKRRAEDLAEAIRGVRDVHNRIRVLSIP
jgi:osmotically-inducible protein OsmY